MDQIARTPTQLGAVLRRERRRRGVSQAELGDRIKKRQATVSNLEATGTGTLETLFSVLAALEMEIVLRPRTKGAAADLEDIF